MNTPVSVTQVRIEKVRISMSMAQLELVTEALKKHSPEGAQLAQDLDEAYAAQLEF